MIIIIIMHLIDKKLAKILIIINLIIVYILLKNQRFVIFLEMYGILINNCYVTDGFGKRTEVIDSNGLIIFFFFNFLYSLI